MRFLKRKHPDTSANPYAVLLALLFLLTGCHADAPSADAPEPASDYSAPKITLTSSDLETVCETPDSIDLNQITTGECLITQPGCHILSGDLDGTIRIDVEDQLVHLVLNGVTVSCAQGPALEVISAGKVFVTLQENTENFLADGAAYPKSTDADACIYSPCDMTINGSGTLHVYGYYKDAVHSKDVLKILGGNLFVQSKRDGLRGNDGVVIRTESLTVQSEENAVHSTKSGKETKGNIEIYDTVCSFIGGKYAISFSTDLYIAGSSVYAIGILADVNTAGISSIEEGNLQNE